MVLSSHGVTLLAHDWSEAVTFGRYMTWSRGQEILTAWQSWFSYLDNLSIHLEADPTTVKYDYFTQ